ncbi:hypothetical protein NESM_000029600 [Novymonas esmeraldas]|uniref:Uncharacterized protein n=1 Tax=Novymonas esmeraldas TaxID=1808958 RepID=A0AAW0F175_9TRYP
MEPSVGRRTGRDGQQCVFYFHAHARASRLLVAHRTMDALVQMLASIAGGDERAVNPFAPTDVNCRGTRVAASPRPTAPQETETTMDSHVSHPAPSEVDYSCVDTEGGAVSATGTPPSVPPTMQPAPLAQPSATTDTQSTSSYQAVPPPSPCATVDALSSAPAAPPAASSEPAQPLPRVPLQLQWTPPRHAVDTAFVRRQQALLAHRRVVAHLSPLELPCGSYASMFAAAAEYSRRTRCFRAAAVTKDTILSTWTLLVHCAALCLLCPTEMDERVQANYSAAQGGRKKLRNLRHGRCGGTGAVDGTLTCSSACLSGVYVHRISDSAFEVGVVVDGAPHDPWLLRLLQCLRQWCLVSLDCSSVALPIGASLRSVSMRLWWTQQETRVTPGSLLPPITVIVEDRVRHPDGARRTRGGGGSTGDADDALFSAYDEAVLFLARPVASQLLGTVALPLPRTISDAPSDSRGALQSTTNGNGRRRRFPPPPPVSGVQGAHLLSRGVVQATLMFADSAVAAVGEHLLAVELQPAPPYRPFVPTLCANLSPFLVVHPSEA